MSATQVNLSWTASTDNVGVTGYQIERCTGASCTTYAQIATATGTTYNNTGLSASTTYRYRVRATDAAGNLSGYSSIANATTQAATDTQAPTTPTSLTATTTSSTQINLSWTASTDNVGVTGYRLERCQGVSCSTFAQIATLTTTTYSYRVRATDAAGNLSGYSTTASATTQAVPDTQAPTAPSSLSAAAASATQINLSWTASTDNVSVTGYRIERCQGAIATPTTTSYSDTGLTAATSYSYRVRATDAAGNLSTHSSTASATTSTPPTTPTGLSTVATSKSEIDLTWSPASGGTGVNGYRLERCQGVGCSSFAQIAAPATTINYDMGLTAATSYSYRVRAIDTGGNLSGYSSVLTVITLTAGTGCD
jgi:chitodextrinase